MMRPIRDRSPQTENATLTRAVLGDALADPREAVAHFAARLRFETDGSDVAAALATGDPGFVLVDSRSSAAWAQGHLPGALHCRPAGTPARAPARAGAAPLVVVYCGGPGCNGATKAALAFARLGHPVQELLGGVQDWSREGLPVERPGGTAR